MCRMHDVELGDAPSSTSRDHHRHPPPSVSSSLPLVDIDDDCCSSSSVAPPSSTWTSSPSSTSNDMRASSSTSTSTSTSTSSPDRHPNSDEGFGSSFLDSLPRAHQMASIGFFMFLFFGMHNILQEAIVNLLNVVVSESGGTAIGHDGSSSTTTTFASDVNWTLMLGYAEVIGVLLFSYIERVKLTTEGGMSRVAPLSAYPLLTLCLFASSSMSNLSLGYINFPTKVVFRSCKLVPTMIIATIVNSRRFKSYEYACALSICVGLALFAMADYTLDPIQFHPTGLMLVSGSVVADAVLPNAQERLFRDGSSRLEVTVYSNLFIFVGMTAVTVGSGTLPRFWNVVARDGTLAAYLAAYAMLSYASISCYMTLVKRFGGVTAVVLTTARKAMTLVLSFVLFPKGFSWLYVHGSLLVLGAVMTASICKKMGIDEGGGRTGRAGEYSSSAYRNDDERDVVSRSDEKSRGSKPPRSSSSSSSFDGFSSDDSQLEKLVADVLESISKRAYT
ncbi:hypothetical protein ACHAXA_006977 [Cyclostephanos tholiformis]|uniref:Uncharacterized protein n=1 Tax=Cyclostephanos tholiformis TaxID=382380 RepID=A0ABD3RXE2_9STRA